MVFLKLSAERALRVIVLGCLSTLAVLGLTACGEEAKVQLPRESSKAETISGNVFDETGPLTQARVEAAGADLKVVAHDQLAGSNRYEISLPAGTRFPVVITAYPDKLGELPLRAVIPAPNNEMMQDVTPVTTTVVNMAVNLGGLTDENIARAAGIAINSRQKVGGKMTTEGFRGDPTQQYGGWH